MCRSSSVGPNEGECNKKCYDNAISLEVSEKTFIVVELLVLLLVRLVEPCYYSYSSWLRISLHEISHLAQGFVVGLVSPSQPFQSSQTLTITSSNPSRECDNLPDIWHTCEISQESIEP
jgi:hypothetical protein